MSEQSIMWPRIRFSDNARWREEERKKGKDRFKVIEEKWLEESRPNINITLGSVMAVYRNVRENYEFRLRYDIKCINHK